MNTRAVKPKVGDNVVRSSETNHTAKRRQFLDAPSAVRCRADVTLRDGSKAQCGRREMFKGGKLCWQHLGRKL